MAVTYSYKVLGQTQPANTPTLVYSTPAGKSTVVSTVSLSNVSFADALVDLNVYVPSIAPTVGRTDYWVSKGTFPGYQPQITGLAYGNNSYVAVGKYGSSPVNMAIWSSTDAVTWVTRAQYGNGQSFNGVAFGNGYFVAVGDYGYVLNSTDGITWVSRSSSWAGNQTLSGKVMDVVFGADKFVITGYNGYSNYSSNGSSWSNGDSLSGGGSSEITLGYGNDVYMATVGTTIYKTSTNGVFWTTRTNPSSGYSVTALNYVNGNYVMGAAILRTSTDGITWTTQTNPFGTTIAGFASGGNTLVGVANGSPIRVSTDGITWTLPRISESTTASNVAYTGTTFIANSGYSIVETVPYSGIDNALLYQTLVPANSTTNLTLGLTLGEGESLYARTPISGAITVHAFGSEIS